MTAGSDDEAFREQLAWLRERSAFYRDRLPDVGLDDIAALPLTTKQELRESVTADNPIGAHLCVGRAEIARIYSTSGTTGAPSFIPLTAGDLENWVTASARSYATSGVMGGERVVTTYGAGPFVAGAALAGLERIGVSHIPVGPGNSERVLRAIELLEPEAVALTPSYAAYLAEKAELRGSSVKRLLVAGEPGGGEPAFRARLEEAWGARVTEAMGVGDIGVSLFGECEEQAGMHLGAAGFVHVELIDPESGEPVPLADDATGELVLTHLRHRAAPLVRFRTRDHVRVWTSPCACGRTSLRLRCIGRTDDMLIVRGVNVFPSALREVVGEFTPAVSGHIVVRPRQGAPPSVTVELAEGAASDDSLARAICERVREVLIVQTEVELVPFGTLARSDYKAKLVER